MTTLIKTDKVQQAVQIACQEAGRSDQVTLVAVSKYLDLPTTQALLDTGVRHLGENRSDKFLEKYQAFQGQGVVWHYIGSLQRRKVKEVINKIDYFHALDSLSLAQEIQKRATKTINCFIQVNLSGEATKHGFSAEELLDSLPLLAELDKIKVVGLMTMAPLEASWSELHHLFAQTRQLRDQLQEKHVKNMPLTELSMGMSGDFAIAIQEGATVVRIGSLFID